MKWAESELLQIPGVRLVMKPRLPILAFKIQPEDIHHSADELDSLNLRILERIGRLCFGLRRLVGKGGHEAAVPLPQVARTMLAEYLNAERHRAGADDPLFVVRFKVKGGGSREERMRDHRVFKLIKALGKQAGIPKLHPHAFRHSCGVELLRRTHGNLRAVQEHLRHADIQTTTLYTRLTQGDLEKVVSVFDVKGD